MTTSLIAWGKRHSSIFLYLLLCLILMACSSFFLSNRYRLANELGFAPPKEIENIKAHSDEQAIDANHWFSFECPDSTIHTLQEKLNLQYESADPVTVSSDAPPSLRWWDSSLVDHAPALMRVDVNKRLGWYLWYNTASHKAYLHTFDY